MNVLPSSTPSTSASAGAATAARNDAPGGSETGSFAQVLGQRLQPREQDAAPATPARRAGARKPQEEGDTIEANPLPLIAPALDLRALAMPKGQVDRERAAKGSDPAAAATPLAGAAAASEDASAMAPDALAALAQGEAAPRLRAHAEGAPARVRPEAATPQADADPKAVGPAVAVPVAAPRSLHGADARGDADATRQAADAVPVSAAQPRADDRSSAPAEAKDLLRSAAPQAAPEQEALRPHTGADAQSNATLAPAQITQATATATVAPVARPEASSPAQGHVAPAVGNPAWAPALGNEVARMHQAGHGQAQLELNPPGLGPLSVTLSVADQQAQAVFVSPHPAVRAAVEAALPHLRTALAENGISLGQASVGAEHQPGSGASSQASQDPGPQRRAVPAPFAVPERAAAVAPAPRRGGGHAVDTFA